MLRELTIENVAVIETYYGKATMPNNISISEMITENPAEVRIKDMTLGTVFEEDENSTLEKVSGSLVRTKNKMQNDFKLKLSGIRTEI